MLTLKILQRLVLHISGYLLFSIRMEISPEVLIPSRDILLRKRVSLIWRLETMAFEKAVTLIPHPKGF